MISSYTGHCKYQFQWYNCPVNSFDCISVQEKQAHIHNIFIFLIHSVQVLFIHLSGMIAGHTAVFAEHVTHWSHAGFLLSPPSPPTPLSADIPTIIYPRGGNLQGNQNKEEDRGDNNVCVV